MLRIWSNAARFTNWSDAFGQMMRILSNATRFTNWSDALRIWMRILVKCTLHSNRLYASRLLSITPGLPNHPHSAGDTCILTSSPAHPHKVNYHQPMMKISSNT